MTTVSARRKVKILSSGRTAILELLAEQSLTLFGVSIRQARNVLAHVEPGQEARILFAWSGKGSSGP